MGQAAAAAADRPLLKLKIGGPGSQTDLDILYSAGRSALIPAARLLTELGAWWVVQLGCGLGLVTTSTLGLRRG